MSASKPRNQQGRKPKRNYAPKPKSEKPKTPKPTGHAPVDRPKATSNGVYQVVSLVKLPSLEKRMIINEAEGEVVLNWRLKHDGGEAALKMLRLMYEANGWTVTVEKPVLAIDEVA